MPPRLRCASCLCAVLALGVTLTAGRVTAASRTVRVGIYENEPKIFVDRRGRPAGLFIDLLKQIAAREGWKLSYTTCAWERCLAALRSGRIDLMPDVARSPERERLFDFHQTPVAESWSRLYARAGAHVSSLADLDGRRVAVLGGSIQQTELGRDIRGFGLKLTTVPATTLKQAFRLAADGRADAAIANHFFGEYFYRDYGLVGTPIVFNLASLYYATARGRNADLLEAIDRHLNRWLGQPQSPYYTTLLRWTRMTPVASARVPAYVYWVIGVIGGLLVAAFGSAYLLRMQVRSRTRHLEQALEKEKESERRYRRLAEEWQATFDATADVIWILDAEQRIVRSNKAAERVFGRSEAEMVGRPNYEVALKIDAPLPGSPFRRMLETRRRESLEMEIGERWFNVVVDPILDADRNVLGAVNILQDISERRRADEERRQLEAQLIQAQRIEAVGQLAGGIAHDFNNMLSIILGYGQLLLAGLGPQDPLREDVEAIVDAGKRSAVLTRQLLAFSRQQTLQPETIDLGLVVTNAERMLRSLLGEGIELKLVLSPGLAPVLVDPSQIEQVIVNLVINARDAMPRGGELIIETKNVVLVDSDAGDHPGLAPGEYVMLAVTDTGCGMDRDVLARIFEPFFTTKEEGKGTGLGLATVYGVVKQSDGYIYAASEVGRGTTFELYLPQAEPLGERVEAGGEGERRPAGGERILVVEDELALRKLLAEMLAKLGYRVTVAAGGREALRMMEEEELSPDLLLTDVIMPGLDGFALAERLRKKRPALRVLYMSGYATGAPGGHDGPEPGASFIEKPINLSELPRQIREAMGRSAV